MNKIDAYVYELVGFNFQDKDKEQKDVHLVETKLQNVLPMGYGYYYVGMNHIDIYPYKCLGFPSANTIVMGGEEDKAGIDSLLIPYQNKEKAKEIFSKWLDSLGYKQSAKRVKENEVETFIENVHTPGGEELKYVKRLDRAKMTEIIDDFCHTTRWLLENLPEEE